MNNIVAGFSGAQFSAEDVDFVINNRERLGRTLEDLDVEELAPFSLDGHFNDLSKYWF